MKPTPLAAALLLLSTCAAQRPAPRFDLHAGPRAHQMRAVAQYVWPDRPEWELHAYHPEHDEWRPMGQAQGVTVILQAHPSYTDYLVIMRCDGTMKTRVVVLEKMRLRDKYPPRGSAKDDN